MVGRPACRAGGGTGEAGFSPGLPAGHARRTGMPGWRNGSPASGPGATADLSGYFGEEGGGQNVTLPGGLLGHLVPTGWFYQNQFRCARMMVNYFIPVANVNQDTFSPE